MQHHITSVRGLACIASAAAFAGAVACSGSDSTGVSVGTTSQLGFVATNSTTASTSIVPVTVGGHTLDLTTVTVTVSRAELKRAKSDACPGDDDEDDDHPRNATSTDACGELKIGPTTIDLPVAGNVVTVPANTIPAGTFREFELRISQVELKGTFDGTAFDVTVPVHVKAELELSTPIVVTADTPASVTVSVPVAGWLVNNDGTLINPSTIGGNTALQAQIRNRITASFRAFEDHDHDGHEDHGGPGR